MHSLSGQEENEAENSWVQDQPRGKEDALPAHSRLQTPENSRLSQLLSALLGKVPMRPEGSQLSRTEATLITIIPTNAILILGYWQKSELIRSERQTWLSHSFHTEFNFPTQTPVHTEPPTQTLLPLKDSAPAQQTQHLLSCWDVGLQPVRSPAHALLLGAYHLIKNNTQLWGTEPVMYTELSPLPPSLSACQVQVYNTVTLLSSTQVP